MSAARPLFVALAVIALFSALWCTSAQAVKQEQPVELPPFKPTVRVSSLMTGFATGINSIRDALPDADDENRLHKISAWSDVIAELSNVHTRHRKKQAYIDMAANTGAIALEMGRTARAEIPDEDKLRTLFTKLDTSCATCHDSDDK